MQVIGSDLVKRIKKSSFALFLFIPISFQIKIELYLFKFQFLNYSTQRIYQNRKINECSNFVLNIHLLNKKKIDNYD
jgi:hypothetical protein